MIPVSPIIPGVRIEEITYAANQPEYGNLPAYRDEDGTILTRWHMTWRERLSVLLTGDIYLWVSTFNQPLQPVILQVEKPEVK